MNLYYEVDKNLENSYRQNFDKVCSELNLEINVDNFVLYWKGVIQTSPPISISFLKLKEIGHNIFIKIIENEINNKLKS